MKKIFLILLILSIAFQIFSQTPKTDANIIGHVTSNGTHVSFANVVIKGTTIGTVTDETGHYHLVHLPIGQATIVVSLIGYKPQEKIVITEANKTLEVKFELEEDALNLGEVVVSADRSTQKRTEAPIIVNTLSPKLFNPIVNP
ncbi:MAG: carboxypeptidase-like regulatory domain-containing protein [Bacteroidales bacterium]|jgi:outer membrane receptor for ferrienterochelin and colicins|nr:carboxypeptidase-like regulatory domain-containing protein [Bacteroidales bacterium]